MAKRQELKEGPKPDDPETGRGRRNRFSPTQLKQALNAVIELGLTVGSIELDDRRSFRIVIETQANKKHPQSDFDLWEEKL